MKPSQKKTLPRNKFLSLRIHPDSCTKGDPTRRPKAKHIRSLVAMSRTLDVDISRLVCLESRMTGRLLTMLTLRITGTSDLNRAEAPSAGGTQAVGVV